MIDGTSFLDDARERVVELRRLAEPGRATEAELDELACLEWMLVRSAAS